MCGIVGFTGRRDPAVLRAMCDAVRHRGPDGEGFASAGAGRAPAVHFGHRRLAVIDLEGGAQPMATPDGQWLITFNGEIYNHADLRRDLESRVTFRTRSDTEVLLQALAVWGTDALTRLDGMFAFAAFDRGRHRLLLAVDRTGQKPLVWSILRDGTLAFASELTALRQHPGLDTEWDRLAFCRALAFSAVPAPQTVLTGVQRLEPGTALEAEVDAHGRVVTSAVRRWWRPFPAQGRAALAASELTTEAFVEGLRQSVRRHLVSDVPIGVLLSGGIDSTIVAALAAEQGPLVSVSMGFGDADYDESAQARETARLLGTEHHEFSLSPAQAVESLETILRHTDEPLADAGCLPAWHLYRHTRRRLTVALGGDGGDELLEGYPTFFAMDLARRLTFPGVARIGAALARVAGLVPVSESYYPLGYQLRRFFSGLAVAPEHRLPIYMGGCAPDRVREVVRPEILEAAGLALAPASFLARLYEPALPEALRDETARLDPHDLDVWLHLRMFLSGQVLRKVDQMSMAHGLEVRAPMLGELFAERCLAAPSRVRRRGRTGKLPLRRWLARSPLAASARRPKRGFAIPVARWLRHEFRAKGDALFLERASPLAEWCRPEPLRQLWIRHRDGHDDARKELWALLTLGVWLQYEPERRPVCAAATA